MAKSFSLNIAAAAVYIGKSVFPFNLSIFPVMKDIAPAYGILAVILLAAGVVLTKDKDRPLAVFGIFWFLLFLLPAFFRPIPEIVAPHLDFSEHRVYVPIIGILIVISQIGVVKRFDVTKIPQAALAFLLMIFFSAISFGHSGAFKDRMSFAAKAVAASPHAAWARVSLGTVYYLGGDLEKAEAEHKKALELNPHQPMAHVKLGVIYEGRGLTAEAEKEFRKEIAINPLYDGTWVALGALYYKKGRFREAEGAWLTALELNPDNPAARNNLAVCRKSI
jgi:tetratricopeptide (TPR) repeat protein